MREHRQHRYVFDQYLGDQFAQSRSLCDRTEMAHQDRAKAQSLIGINDRKSDFSLAWCDDDKPSSSHDGGPAILIRYCDQCDVVDKVDIQKVVQLLLGDVLPRREKSSEYGFR